MTNEFITRKKFGRWKFDLYVVIYYIIVITISHLLFQEFADPTTEQLNQSIEGGVAAIIGLFILFFVIELVSTLNSSLINDLSKKRVIAGEEKDIREKLTKIIWSNKVYWFAAILFVTIALVFVLGFFIEGTEAITYSEDYIPIAVIMGAFTQIVLALTLAEMVWVIAMPIIIIFLLPYLGEEKQKELDHGDNFVSKIKTRIKNWFPTLDLSLDVFANDNSMGLSPISNYLLKVSLLITFFGTTLLYWTQHTIFLFAVALLIAVLAAPIIYFIFPTIGLNSLMANTKEHALDELNGKLREAYTDITQGGASWSDQSLQNILLMINEVEKKKEWPFSTRGLRNLISSFLIPIAIFIMNNVDSIVSFFSGN